MLVRPVTGEAFPSLILSQLAAGKNIQDAGGGTLTGRSICVGDLLIDETAALSGVKSAVAEIRIDRITQLLAACGNAAGLCLAEALVCRPVADLAQRQRVLVTFVPASRRVDDRSDHRRVVYGG